MKSIIFSVNSELYLLQIIIAFAHKERIGKVTRMKKNVDNSKKTIDIGTIIS